MTAFVPFFPRVVCEDNVLDPLTMCAFWSSPALLTHLNSRRITVKMAEKVISCPTEFGALWAVVIGITAESQAVFQSERATVMVEHLPLLTWVQHRGKQHSLYKFLLT